jgi:hypothetical protein
MGAINVIDFKFSDTDQSQYLTPGLQDLSWDNKPRGEKLIPNYHQIHPMAVKYTKHIHLRPSKTHQNWHFWNANVPFGNPV